MRSLTAVITDNLLLAITVSFITGIALAHPWRLADGTITALGAVLALALLALLYLHYNRRRSLLLWLLLPIFTATGFWHSQLQLRPPNASGHIFSRIEEKTEAVLIGTLAAMVEDDGRSSRIRLHTEQIQRRDDPTLIPCSGTVLLRFYGRWHKPLMPGDRLAIRAELNRPSGFLTPGGFDLASHYARNDIWVTGIIRSPLYIEKIIASESLWHTLRFLPERVRTTIGEKLDLALPEPQQSAMYRAILLGDRSRLEERILEDFKASGTMHILAISGLHIGILSALLYTVISRLLSCSEWLLLRLPVRKCAALLALPILLCYGLLAGLNTPVTRAVLMGGLVLLAISVDRRKSPGALLAFAALTILAIKPLLLFNVSFQLSFAAVTALLFLLPELQQLVWPKADPGKEYTPAKKAGSWLLAALLVSIVANLATAPIAIHAFQRFSTVSLLANLVMEPLICLWSLVAGFIALPLVFLLPDTGTLLLRFGALGLDAALGCAAFFAGLPSASLRLPPPPLWLIGGYYALLLILINNRYRPLLGLPALGGVLVFLLLIFRPPPGSPATGALHIAAIDVGQGSSTLVELPSGYRLLIDGGGASLPGRSVGERVIAPYLWRRGIRWLDAVVITHPDADHYNGLEFIIANFAPRLLWVRGQDNHPEDFSRLLLQAEQHGVQVTVPAEGERLGTARDFVVNLANSYHFPTAAGKGKANSGLVLKVCSGTFCLLLPGDIEQEDESLLVEKGYDLGAKVLLAPHHGADTSSSVEFLAGVSPEIILVSAGPNRQGSFPGGQLINHSARHNLPLWTTAEKGTMELRAAADRLTVHGYGRVDSNPLTPLQRTLLYNGSSPGMAHPQAGSSSEPAR
ncbi:MAG: DNA internalization-related competence protein ComEC/Rec2 [Desulforhopalus sp.]|nr:DNA internalization-related competence protein ComEC/Rec2 [Desulforhopalus sp.]